VRRPRDAYATPAWQAWALLANQPDLGGLILEPCVGAGALARVLMAGCPGRVLTNDVDPGYHARYGYDATNPRLYDQIEQDEGRAVDWIVTNPPYRMPVCRDLVALAIERARIGVAMLLRLSFLEPTARRFPRGVLLTAHPPSRLLVLPRNSYLENGHSDVVTTAWFLWCRPEAVAGLPPIQSLHLAHRTPARPVVAA